ncbi:hypothetical protein [Paraglaciecola polaris]|uniref:STAS/SEC14 domain-containing protein n=1 Tax=Paraglaciecola polaris LMG 21857 TaxID=1129793 RepID=K6Z918_9ALTE|nr:hypothetical protein [Paraglaciecola polaris]GAC32661.1 hypothetical protein GPLA_1751 [Paraglaciecola polaris LMG 21857]|tara:strand:- start:5372 stop:5809 length:438 start_codon:yes stop_codon:yes gene_type:complete
MSHSPSFTATLDGNILITEIVGTIDKVMYRKVFGCVKQQVFGLNGAPWANIIFAEQWELSALDIDGILIEIEAWVRLHNRTHLVFVVGEEHVQIKRFTLKQYLGNNLNKDSVTICDTREQGMRWLYEQGFALNSQSSPFASFSLE